jgi:hypothetical protein
MLRLSAARRPVMPVSGGGATARRFMREGFGEELGGNWGYPDVHDIGNSGKDG